MAAINDLIAQVQDAELRKACAMRLTVIYGIH